MGVSVPSPTQEDVHARTSSTSRPNVECVRRKPCTSGSTASTRSPWATTDTNSRGDAAWAPREMRRQRLHSSVFNAGKIRSNRAVGCVEDTAKQARLPDQAATGQRKHGSAMGRALGARHVEGHHKAVRSVEEPDLGVQVEGDVPVAVPSRIAVQKLDSGLRRASFGEARLVRGPRRTSAAIAGLATHGAAYGLRKGEARIREPISQVRDMPPRPVRMGKILGIGGPQNHQASRARLAAGHVGVRCGAGGEWPPFSRRDPAAGP